MFTSKGISVVFDLSLRHYRGRRIVDTVKNQLTEWLQASLEEHEDVFYLYHPDVLEPVFSVGEAVAAVMNYETDGGLFDHRYALVQSFYILIGQDVSQRCLLFVTDRLQDKMIAKKLVTLRHREQIDAEIILVGIGKQYDKEALEVEGALTFHLDDPAELANRLSTILWSE